MFKTKSRATGIEIELVKSESFGSAIICKITTTCLGQVRQSQYHFLDKLSLHWLPVWGLDNVLNVLCSDGDVTVPTSSIGLSNLQMWMFSAPIAMSINSYLSFFSCFSPQHILA